LLHCQIILCALAAIDKRGPELFDKDAKVDKLIIKGQIAYHFKRIVREVSQELFISRKIDVAPLLNGVNVLKQTQVDVLKFCNGLSKAVMNEKTEWQKSGYVLIERPEVASFKEAKARCQARGLQLPEVYHWHQADDLTDFLREKRLDACFAGIEPDIADSISRHISTQFPIWKSFFNLTKSDGSSVMTIMMDDINAKFLYTSSGKMIYSLDTPSPVDVNQIGWNTYRDTHKEMSQLILPIVCEQRWDGLSYGMRNDHVKLDDFNVRNRLQRAADPVVPEPQAIWPAKTDTLKLGDQGIKDLCFSVANQAEEAAFDMSAKMTELLSLVDISVHTEVNGPLDRVRRGLLMAKFIFTTGVKLIWGLFGFVQKMRMSNRIKRLETAFNVTRQQVEQNTNAIHDMSQLMYGQTIAVNQLTMATADLDRRVTVVENKVQLLAALMGEVINKLDIALALALIANLIIRVQQSLNSGYDVLKDIIHCSLLGQTSPLILPYEQMVLVQNEVQKVSTALLDPDFSKMQSVIVSDPGDPHLLLVVVNVAAISRSTVELVKLVAIPFFEGPDTYTPILDYNTIVLNQVAQTYAVLSEQEEYDCIFHRCYVSNAERSISERSCGIPQLYEKQAEACVSVSTPTNGVFLKPMLPDGVLFAFPEEVNAQLFCKDNSIIGPTYKMNGTGILQLPNGCTLSITDHKDRNSRVRGQPLYRMIDAADIELVASGPLKALKSFTGPEGIHRLSTYGELFNEHMSSVVDRVTTVDNKISHHSNYIWGLIGATSLILTLTIAVVWFSYKYSGRFRRKIWDLRDQIAVITRQLLTLEIDHTGIHQRRDPPPVPPKTGARFEKLKARVRAYHRERPMALAGINDPREPSYLDCNELSARPRRPEERVYQPLSAFAPSIHQDPARFYPRLTPMLRALSKEELAYESQEVEELCAAKPFEPKTQSQP